MRDISILYLITELNIGGAEKIVAQIATHLSKDRYNILVSCLYDPGPVADEIAKNGVQVVNLGMRGKWDVRAAYRLFRLLRQENIQILHSHLFHANLLGRTIGRMAGVPIIISSRRSVDIGGRGRELLNRWTNYLTDVIVAVCDQVRQVEIQKSGIQPDKVVTIYNGVELDKFDSPDSREAQQLRARFSIEPAAPLIGMIGRFHEAKGLPILGRAIPEILERFPKIKVLLVGDGELRPVIEHQVESLGVDETVTFTGICHHIPEILSLLDLLVLPSLWEGLPNVILEAMAAGKPVVATAVGGTPEAVEDGVTGLLVPPRDPEALAKAIIALLQDRERAEAMGRAGRERVERCFSVERMVQQTEALYTDLIEEKIERA